MAAGRIVRDVDVVATGSGIGIDRIDVDGLDVDGLDDGRLGVAGWFVAAGGTDDAGGCADRAAGAAGCGAALAGKRRTTAGSVLFGCVDAVLIDPVRIDPVRAECAAADATAADGAGRSERRAVAAATVNAGPVARRSAVGATTVGCDDGAVSTADINASTEVIPRAAVSPGAVRTGAGLGVDATSGVDDVDSAGSRTGATRDVTGGDWAADGAGSDADVDDPDTDAGVGAGSVVGGEDGAGLAAIERRTTGLAAGAAALAVPATGDRAGALAAAAAARERGVAACRSAAHRPAGGLTAEAAEMAATPAGVIGPDPNDGADFGAFPAGAGAACVGAVGMRRTTFAERSAALAADGLDPGEASAGRGPASPARFDGARSPGERSPDERFAGPRGAGVRSRSTSIGPTDVTSGGRRTRTTSPPIRSAMCPGRGPSARPVRTTRGKPRGGTGVGSTAVDWAAVDWAGVAAASAWPCIDHQYCHHRGGCTPCPAWRARIGSGPRSDRRTSGECAVAAAKRVAAIATLPIGDGRSRVSGGPGRRNRRATSCPRLGSPVASLICSRTRDG